MTIKSSGPISIADIAAELRISAEGLGLGDSRVRALLGHPTGAVYMSSAYGKSAGYSGTLTIGLLASTREDNVGYNPLTATGASSGSGDVAGNNVQPARLLFRFYRPTNTYTLNISFGILSSSLPIPVTVRLNNQRSFIIPSSKVGIPITADDYNWIRGLVGTTIPILITE